MTRPPSDADTGIETLHREWCSAMARGDLESVLAMLTPDYLLWAPGRAPVVGRDALRGMMSAALEAFAIEAAFESLERIVSGDLAVEIGIDTQRVRPRAGGDWIERRQRVFLLLRRDEDGSWRYARGMSQPGPDA